MSDDYQRIEVITGAARRRRWTTEEKLRIDDETLRSGESISIVARRHGVAPTGMALISSPDSERFSVSGGRVP